MNDEKLHTDSENTIDALEAFRLNGRSELLTSNHQAVRERDSVGD